MERKLNLLIQQQYDLELYGVCSDIAYIYVYIPFYINI